MKNVVLFSALAASLSFFTACNTTATSEGSAANATVAPKPEPQTSLNTASPESLLKSAPVDEETKKTVESEITKRNIDKKDADGLLEEAKKHMSEEDIEDAVKKLKSAIKGYGDKKPE